MLRRLIPEKRESATISPFVVLKNARWLFSLQRTSSIMVIVRSFPKPWRNHLCRILSKVLLQGQVGSTDAKPQRDFMFRVAHTMPSFHQFLSMVLFIQACSSSKFVSTPWQYGKAAEWTAYLLTNLKIAGSIPASATTSTTHPVWSSG